MADEEGEEDQGNADRDDTGRVGGRALQAADQLELRETPRKSEIT